MAIPIQKHTAPLSVILQWPSLWKREPALWPHKAESPFNAGEDSQFIRGVVDTERMEVDDATIAALCRDAAVLWLARRGIWLDGDNHDGTWECVEQSVGEVVSVPFNTGRFATPDEALFAACVDVLDKHDSGTRF